MKVTQDLGMALCSGGSVGARAGRGCVFRSRVLRGVAYLAVWVTFEGWAAGLRPFLPRVGPVPLRFEEPFPEMASKYSLPPLDFGSTNNAFSTAIPTSLDGGDPNTIEAGTDLDLGQDPFVKLPLGSEGLPSPPSPPPVTPTPAPEPTPAPAPPPPLVEPMTSEGDAVTPREIIRYLNNRGAQGNTATGVFSLPNKGIYVAPIGFQPPAPGQPSSSTYTSPPPPSK
jgi:hypothetical protein